MWFVLLSMLATPQQFDHAGRAVFAVLRDFQRVEIESYAAVRAGKGTWPSLEQHQQITEADVQRQAILKHRRRIRGHGCS